MIQVAGINYDGQASTVNLNKLPDECPFCHRSITPRIHGSAFILESKAQVLLLCPRLECQKIFIAYYVQLNQQNSTRTLQGVSKGEKKSVEVPEDIKEISSAFVKIYEQANIAEQEGLLEICGVGYRKAIEFLVKDYAIKKHTISVEGISDVSEKEKIEKQNIETIAAIEKKLLAACINDYIDNARIKSAVTRATWLGNDETHYVRKWEGKNLDDLKSLIRATILWMELEAETDRYEKEMTK